MCVDSAVRPEDFQGPPVGLWPCHEQGGNQVFFDFSSARTRNSQIENLKSLINITVVQVTVWRRFTQLIFLFQLQFSGSGGVSKIGRMFWQHFLEHSTKLCLIGAETLY